MRFAIVNGTKMNPQPKQRGSCLHCGAEMVSKCGRTKVWHWAHKTRDICDPWWENETEWHRSWKDNFPAEWQEISAFDESTGERHIADVKTPYGLVVEFQHSAMPFEELKAREKFYKNMIWIVDGLRGELDLSFFQMGVGRQPIQDNPLAYGLHWLGRGKIMHNWSDANSRVFIDFGNNFTQGTHTLWRLIMFDKKKKRGAVAPYQKDWIIKAILNQEEIGVPYIASK